LQIGDLIQERFQLQDLIGEGSFGQVYKVLDQKQRN
jgi:casein kinase I homolog HRR25